jgi:DNA-binding NarL/FixJ family response regulator
MVLLDLSIPKISGISVMKEIKRDLPDTKILALTIHESDQYVLEAFDAGVDGYCIKDASRQELMLAIDSVLQGKSYISPGISDQVIEGYLDGRKTLKEESDWDTVTQREREVLKLLAEGFANKEIAAFLHISVKTVEKHRWNLITYFPHPTDLIILIFQTRHFVSRTPIIFSFSSAPGCHIGASHFIEPTT